MNNQRSRRLTIRKEVLEHIISGSREMASPLHKIVGSGLIPQNQEHACLIAAIYENEEREVDLQTLFCMLPPQSN